MRLNLRLAFLATCFSAMIALEGCGAGNFNQAASNQLSVTQYTIKGHLQQPSSVRATYGTSARPETALPVSGATVYLYAAGTAGYGSAATLLAITTSTTSGGGTFSFSQNASHVNSLANITNTYSCPSYTFPSANGASSITEDSFLYLVAVGGDTQDGSGQAHTNTGAVFMAALGDCQQLAQAEPFVDVNPVTTVASAFALQSYLSPVYPTAVVNGSSMTLVGGALGTSTSYQTGYGSAQNGGFIAGGANQGVAAIPMGYTGMMNAFKTVPLLVNLAGGSANSSFQTSNAALGVTVTGTPEQAKINQLANALAYCIDTSNTASGLSSQCSSLFALTVPPVSSSTTSLGAVTFPAATDTLQAAYYMAVNPTDNVANGTPTAGSTSNLSKIYNLASAQPDFLPGLSSQPSDWTISIAYTSTSTCGTDATPGSFLGPNPWTVASDLYGNVAVINGNAASTLAAITPGGLPSVCQLGALANGRTVLYDTAGNLWVQGGLPALFESTGTGAPITWPTTDGTTTFQASAMTADGKGNLFYAASTTGTLERFAGAQGNLTPFNSQIAGTAIGSTANIYYMAADTAGDIYYPNTSLHNQILEATPVSGGYYTNALVGSTLYYPYGAAVDAGNNFISFQDCCSASYNDDTPIRTKATYSPTTGAQTTDTNTFGTANIGGLEVPRQVAIDGAGNLWGAMLYASQSYASGGSTFGLWGVAEYNTALAPLSPNASTTFSTSVCSTSGGAPATGCNIGGGYSKYSLGEARGIVIDISGNVWVPADLSVNGAANGNLVEIVGAGVPTVQPIAVALRDGKLGAKP